MKMIKRYWASAMVGITLCVTTATAQKIDEDRMVRDIEVAENVLSTLIKQEMGNQRTYFGMDINGSYQEGYGVTFRFPMESVIFYSSEVAGHAVYRGSVSPAVSVYRTEGEGQSSEHRIKEKDKVKEKGKLAADSARDEYNKRLIKASKDFVLDYGDFISQLGANERIVVTNRGDRRSWYIQDNKRSYISIEGMKSDILAYKQGKLTRDQALAKLKVVNSEYVDEKETDLELLASIFNRLYRPDLSKTFFSENNIYYERLKDYGVIFYMQVYSSNQSEYKRFIMPTQGLESVDEETRNKRVVELYPKFEEEIKDNILEYGRTIKSLADNETVVFNITLTKCKDCGIPSTLEYSVKSSVLKEYGMGKMDKASALTKFTLKKGPKQ